MGIGMVFCGLMAIVVGGGIGWWLLSGKSVADESIAHFTDSSSDVSNFPRDPYERSSIVDPYEKSSVVDSYENSGIADSYQKSNVGDATVPDHLPDSHDGSKSD